MKVSIDPFAGFCFGVERAIEIADDELKQNNKLYCLGEIVHNEVEIHRLENAGLSTIDSKELHLSLDSKVLFRAHGEPPSTYEKALKNEIKIIDATCPIVLKFQQKVKKAWDEMKLVNGQIVIFGKANHPEVIGLNGQTDNNAILVEDKKDLEKIDPNLPVRLFVQTTKSKNEYDKIVTLIMQKLKSTDHMVPDFKYYNTICRQVSQRIPKLIKFCLENEVIIFISGKNSSNGSQLFSVCKSENNKSYFISNENDIKPDWFIATKSVGISGATSTPVWLMKKIADQISNY